MIIRKPYAFLIKHFRVIHLTLSIAILYLIIRFHNIFTFFSDYAKNGYYNLVQAMNTFVSLPMIMVAIFVLVIGLIIYFLMRWKNKNRAYYIALIVFYLALIVGLIFYSYVIQNVLNVSSVDVRDVRAFRDISLILYIPQYFFLIISGIRAIGFDVEKFDFKKDLEELDISEEDREEIEVNFGENSYKFERFFRKFFREIKYYIIENKTFLIVILLILVITIPSIFIYINLSKGKEVYNESEIFISDGISFKVENSYISNVDYKGSIIKEGYNYIVVKLNMENTNRIKTKLNTDLLRLVTDDKSYFPVFYPYNYFKDIAEGYNKNYNLSTGEVKEYILVYEVPDSVKDNIRFRVTNGGSNYKEVILKPTQYFKDSSDTYVYTKDVAIDLSDSTLKTSEILLNSYEFGDNFTISYPCGSITCKTVVSPDNIGINERTILNLDMEVILDETLYINKYINNTSSFLDTFLTISYLKDDEEIFVKGNVKKLNIDTKNNAYIEVPKEVSESNQVKLYIKVRDKDYIINLY